MSNPPNDFLAYNHPTIRVICISNKRLKIITARIEGNKAKVDKDFSITFKTKQVGAVHLRSRQAFGQRRWLQAIMWREGLSEAMDWEPKIVTCKCGATLGEDFIPPLTQRENAHMITRMVAEAKAKLGRLLGSGQFIAIMVGLVVVIVLLIAVLLGVKITLPSKVG